MKAITPEIVSGPNLETRIKRKYPGYCPRYQAARLLQRHKDTLNRWDNLLLIANEDYRNLSLGSRKPLHPYQVELLSQISNYQFRSSDPRVNRDEDELLQYIFDRADIWTEKNWIANNYQLPNHDHNQRTS